MTLSWGDLAPTEHSARHDAADTIQTRLARLALAIARRSDLWRPLVRHDPDLRWHARLADLGDVEIWLLGWMYEQQVELHDHGGSSGAFAVAEGELHEDFTTRAARGPLRRAVCPTGSVRAFGPERVHHVTNRASAPATSIHVYAPPLSAMHFYDLAPGAAPRAVRTEHVLQEEVL
jgi:predicted metal-dependent enzyme (double-stranded beta helix superfamily)